MTFRAICGPDTQSQPQSVTAQPHPTSDQPGVPSAYFTLTNDGTAGTDLVSATTTDASGQPVAATASVRWVRPVDCGQPLPKLGYLLALQCKLAAARPLVETALQVGSCALGVATFFVPVAKIANLLDEAGTVTTFEVLAARTALTNPVAKLVFDLRQVAREGIPGMSLSDIKNAFEDAKSAPAFLSAIVGFVSKVAKFPEGNISDIALDVADLTGLQPCVELLAKIVVNSSSAQTAAGVLYRTFKSTWDASGVATEKGRTWLAVTTQGLGYRDTTHVYLWSTGRWAQVGLTRTSGGELDGHVHSPSTQYPIIPLQVAHLTNSGDPDFGIPTFGADTPYYSVVSHVGGRWQAALFDFGYKPTTIITAVGSEGHLVKSVVNSTGGGGGLETYIWYSWDGSMFVPASPPGAVPRCSPTDLAKATGRSGITFTRLACADGWALALGVDHSVPKIGKAVGLFNEQHNLWVDVTLDDGAFIGNDPGTYDIPMDLLKRLAARVGLPVRPPVAGL